MQYRPDIDGMRAVAVLGVLFYHAGLGLPGGYVGVDVFFVISGYLITSIILNDLRNNRFSLIHFWRKRIRRILPAVSLVVLCIIITGWFLMPPGDYKRLGQQVLTLIVLSANIKFWKEGDYFDKAADTNPMLHTWSLSVEEQFYLLLPVVLLFLFKYNREKWIYPLLWITIIISFAASVHISHAHPKTNFFLLPTRIWELDMGALIAFRMPSLSRRSANIFSIIGILGILLPYFIYPEEITFPGMSALPPVLGSAMLIIGGTQRKSDSGIRSGAEAPSFVSGILSFKPLVFVGLISYSLYLWHWPILAFQKYLGLDHSNPGVQVLLLACAFLIAWFSWRFIEQPFRKRSNFPKEVHIYIAGAGMTILLLVPATAIVFSNGAQARLDESVQNLYTNRTLLKIPDSFSEDDVHSKSSRPILEGTPQVFVWGDSHSGKIRPAVDKVCKELGINFHPKVRAATAPVLNWHYKDERSLAYNQNVFDEICESRKSNSTVIVMLTARWELYFARHKFGRITAPPGFEEALSTMISELQRNDIKVVICKQVASFPFTPPDAYMRALFLGFDTTHLKTSIEEQKVIMKDANTFFESVKSSGVRLFDPNPTLADENGDIFPVQKVDGLWYSIWNDDNHLSINGSMKLVNELYRLLDGIVSAR